MESTGEEKKLQALYSELKEADEQTAPQFARVWNRAALKPRRVRAFGPAFVAAMGLVVCAVVSFAVWSRYRQPAQTLPVVRLETPAPRVEGSPIATAGLPTATSPSESPKPIITPRRNKPIVRRNTIQLATNRKLTKEAKAITDWESPTSTLLSSPSDSLFSSLPQLNENANGLQSYLPSRPN